MTTTLGTRPLAGRAGPPSHGAGAPRDAARRHRATPRSMPDGSASIFQPFSVELMGMSQHAWFDPGLALDESRDLVLELLRASDEPTLRLAHLSPTEPQPANAWMGEK